MHDAALNDMWSMRSILCRGPWISESTCSSEVTLWQVNTQYLVAHEREKVAWEKILKTVGEYELYLGYFEYQGIPCKGVYFFIQDQVGRGQDIALFTDTVPLPWETGLLAVLLLASICDHFAYGCFIAHKLFCSMVWNFQRAQGTFLQCRVQ